MSRPRTLTSSASCGWALQYGMKCSAAMWKTASGANSATGRRSAELLMSPSTTVSVPGEPCCSRCACLPRLKLSKTRTSFPASRSESTRWDPMNPAPPVTSMRSIYFLASPKSCHLGHALLAVEAGPGHARKPIISGNRGRRRWNPAAPPDRRSAFTRPIPVFTRPIPVFTRLIRPCLADKVTGPWPPARPAMPNGCRGCSCTRCPARARSSTARPRSRDWPRHRPPSAG